MHLVALTAAAIVGLVAAAPQIPGDTAGTVQYVNYYPTVWAPGTTLHDQRLEACGFAFSLGLDGPCAYCPSPIVPPEACPPGNETVVYRGGLQPAVMVPGGQQGYINPSGLVTYTQAHSAYMPPGSFYGGWTQHTIETRTGTLKILDWANSIENNTSGESGVMLCPDAVPEYSSATYILYTKTPKFNQTNCIQVAGIKLNPKADNSLGAWQYT